MYVCLSDVCLSLCLSVCLSVPLSVCLPVCLSVCLSVCLFICFFVLTLCLLSISLPPLSHTGRAITELSVPGVRLQLLKRPYDTKLEFAVQDLCVVDCIQTFGPQFELVVCSSGKTILASSYPQEKPTRPSSVGKGEDSSYSVNSVRFHNINSATRPGDSTLAPPEGSSAHAPQSSHEDTEYVFSPDTEGAELLSLSFQQLSPFSPEHPAMRDRSVGPKDEIKNEKEEEEEEEVDDEGEVTSVYVDGEPNIRRIALNCTAIDIMGKFV